MDLAFWAKDAIANWNILAHSELHIYNVGAVKLSKAFVFIENSKMDRLSSTRRVERNDPGCRVQHSVRYPDHY